MPAVSPSAPAQTASRRDECPENSFAPLGGTRSVQISLGEGGGRLPMPVQHLKHRCGARSNGVHISASRFGRGAGCKSPCVERFFLRSLDTLRVRHLGKCTCLLQAQHTKGCGECFALPTRFLLGTRVYGVCVRVLVQGFAFRAFECSGPGSRKVWGCGILCHPPSRPATAQGLRDSGFQVGPALPDFSVRNTKGTIEQLPQQESGKPIPTCWACASNRSCSKCSAACSFTFAASHHFDMLSSAATHNRLVRRHFLHMANLCLALGAELCLLNQRRTLISLSESTYRLLPGQRRISAVEARYWLGVQYDLSSVCHPSLPLHAACFSISICAFSSELRHRVSASASASCASIS